MLLWIPRAEQAEPQMMHSPTEEKANILAFLNQWDEAAFLSRIHPAIKEKIPDEDLSRLFREVGARLGRMNEYSITPSAFNLVTRNFQGRQHYRIEADFEYGPAVIELGTAMQQNREWIVSFSVESPLLSPVIDAAYKSIKDGRLDYSRFYGEIRSAAV